MSPLTTRPAPQPPTARTRIPHTLAVPTDNRPPLVAGLVRVNLTGLLPQGRRWPTRDEQHQANRAVWEACCADPGAAVELVVGHGEVDPTLVDLIAREGMHLGRIVITGDDPRIVNGWTRALNDAITGRAAA